MLLQEKANANAKNRHRETPLVTAVRLGKTESLKILLKHNADINTKHENDPLTHVAAQHEQFKMVKFLVEADADLDARNKRRQTIR